MDHIPFATMEIRVAPLLSRDPEKATAVWGEFSTYQGRVEPRTMVAYADTSDRLLQRKEITAYIQCDAPLPAQVKLQWSNGGVTIEAPSVQVENYYDPQSGQFVYARVIT